MIATETEAASKIQVSWFIPVELVLLLESFAEAEGIDTEQLVSRILSLGIQEEGITALALASVPAVAVNFKVTQDKAIDVGVMRVSLKNAVKLNYGQQGQLQGAGSGCRGHELQRCETAA